MKIASIKAPCPGVDDFPVWKHTSDGFFSIQSAYLHLFKELNRDPPDFPFCIIWKLQTPPRVNTFLWRVTHNRLMTNSTRFERGISDSASCPRCNQQDESIMHVLRDCEGTLEMWEQLVDPNQWHRFASLGLLQWLEFNLKTDRVGVGDWNWPIVFGSMVHMLWIDRNHYVFSGKSSIPDAFLPKLFGHVDAIHAQLLQPSLLFIDASCEVHVKWDPPPAGVVALNVDGSHI